MAGNVIGSVMLRPCPTQLFQLHTLGEGEELGQDLWERPFPADPSVWDTSLLLQPVCAITSQALVRLSKSGACSTVDIHGYWCNFCQFNTDDKADFAKHVITHRFSCEFCLFSSFTRSNVILHIIASHGEKEASADLKYCVLRMDVEGDESVEEREPLPVSVQKRFFQSLSLSGEVFKKRKLFSQGEGRLSKVAKRFPSDSPSSLSLPYRGLPSAPRLEIDMAEDDMVARVSEESTQVRRCSAVVRGTRSSESPRPSSNCSTRGSSSPHAVRGSQSRPSSQPPSDGSGGFQTLRRLLVQSDEVRRQSLVGWVSDAPNSAARRLGRSSPEDEGLPPASDEEEWMSDFSQESMGNSSASEEFQFHGSLKSIAAKAHHTRLRERCTTTSTSSSSSDHLVQRGRSTSLLQPTAQAAAVRTSRIRSNSLGDEPNGIDRSGQQSGRFPLLHHYLTHDDIVDEHLKGRTRTVRASKKPSDHREIQMEAPILRQCLSQTSQQDSGKHSSPAPQVSSATLPHGVSIKQEPQSEDPVSDAPTACLPVSAPVSGVAVAFAASRGRSSGEINGNGINGSSHEWETGRPIAMSSSVEQRGGFSSAQPGLPTVKQEPLDDSYQYSTFIPTHQSKTSLTTSVMPSCASRSREHTTSSPQFLRDSPPSQSSQQLRSLAETPPPRNTELRRLLAEQRGPSAQHLQAAPEKTPWNGPNGESMTEGKGDVREKPANGHHSSAPEHLPSTRNSSLLRSALMQAGNEVQPANKRPSTDNGSSEVNMHFSRLLQSLVPASQGQSSGAPPPTKSCLLPQLLRSSQPFSPSTSSSVPLSSLPASLPMDLSKRGPPALHSVATIAGNPKPVKSEPPEEAAAPSVAKDDNSSDGMRFLIGDVKSLSGSANCESGSDEPYFEEKENESAEDKNSEDAEGAGISVQNSAEGNPSNGELGYRNQPTNAMNDCVPEVLNLTTSDRTNYSSSDSQGTVTDRSPAGNDPEDLRQKKACETAAHLSASLSPSSSMAPHTGSTSPSGQPTATGVLLCSETVSSPTRSHSNGQEAEDSNPVPGSSKVTPRREGRPAGMSMEYQSLLQFKIGGMGHYLTDNVDSSEHEEVTDEEGNEDYCSGHSSLWTDADKDVRKLTVETEEPGLEEMGEDKRV